jgi:hypothetical protein
MTNHHRDPTYDPRWSWVFISAMGLVALCYVVLMAIPYLSERRRRIEESWPQTEGIPTGTRVVQEPATRTFRYRAYVGECSVMYTVAGKQYTIWTRSGYMHSDQNALASKMTVCPVSHFVVNYNPKDPSEAVTKRWNGPS